MKPQQFLTDVVEPNAIDAMKNPQSVRAAANAILTMDALMGICFWHLHAIGDPTATKHKNNDSAFKDELASCNAVRVLRDAAFSLKHGKLTGPKPRVMDDAKQMNVRANVLGFFRVGDPLGGGLVYLDLQSGAVAARDVISEGFKFLQAYVAALPP